MATPTCQSTLTMTPRMNGHCLGNIGALASKRLNVKVRLGGILELILIFHKHVNYARLTDF